MKGAFFFFFGLGALSKPKTIAVFFVKPKASHHSSESATRRLSTGPTQLKSFIFVNFQKPSALLPASKYTHLADFFFKDTGAKLTSCAASLCICETKLLSSTLLNRLRFPALHGGIRHKRNLHIRLAKRCVGGTCFVTSEDFYTFL